MVVQAEGDAVAQGPGYGHLVQPTPFLQVRQGRTAALAPAERAQLEPWRRLLGAVDHHHATQKHAHAVLQGLVHPMARNEVGLQLPVARHRERVLGLIRDLDALLRPGHKGVAFVGCSKQGAFGVHWICAYATHFASLQRVNRSDNVIENRDSKEIQDQSIFIALIQFEMVVSRNDWETGAAAVKLNSSSMVIQPERHLFTRVFIIDGELNNRIGITLLSIVIHESMSSAFIADKGCNLHVCIVL